MRLFCPKRKVYTIRKKIITLFFIVFVFSMLLLFVYNTCYSGTIKEKAKLKANEITISAINDAVETTFKEMKLNYESFFDLKMRNDMSVSYLVANTVAVNNFKVAVTQKILERISSYDKEFILMSPFSVYGYTYVPFGIRVPVLVVPVEILSTDLDNIFESCGINQTRHNISIMIKIKVKLLLPVGSETFTVETSVPVTEAVIVGDVPDTYTNVEGVTEPGSDAILNLAP